MRIRHLVCIGAVLVLTACSGGGDSEPSDESSAKKTSAAASVPPLSEAEAKKALLTVEDLPDGWKVDPDDDSDDDVKVIKGSKACKQIDEEDDDAPTKVETSFTLDDEAFLSSGIESYDSAKAEKEWDADLAMLDDCRRFTLGDSDGFRVELKVRVTEIDDLGEDAALLYATGTVEGVRMHMDVLGVRDGRNVVGVSALAFGERAPRDQLTAMAQAVLDRLDRLEDIA